MNELELLNRYSELLDLEKRVKEEKELVKEKLIDMESRFVVAQESTRTTVDIKKLQAQFPDVYSKLAETKKTLSIRVKV